MKLINMEVALREETRAVEQARPQLSADVFEDKAYSLIDTQEEIADRLAAVIENIGDLPDGQRQFANEINALTAGDKSMWDAAGILSQPDTGAPAIAAETEAIERLLQASRSDGEGSGGGGSPGGGSRTGADTNQPALALLGNGGAESANFDERETLQATGVTGSEHPEEYRRGLDQYFEQLESRN